MTQNTSRLLVGIAALVGACHNEGLPGPRATVVNLTGSESALAVAVQADGRIVAAGQSDMAHPQALLARFTTDGKLDPSFGTAGTVVTDLAVGQAFTGSGAYALAIQPDGKLVIVGYAWPTGGDSRLAAARYLPDGKLDPGFGQGGYATFDAHPDVPLPGNTSGDSGFAVALQGDGRILVGGSAAVYHANGRYWSDFAVARLNGDGSLDAGFGSGGVAIHDFGGSAFVHALAVLHDGRIVAAGMAAPGGTFYDLALARYDSDGTPDPSFATGGIDVVDLGGDDRGFALTVLGDGSYLIAGQTTTNNAETEFLLARLDGSGALDPRLGGSGWVTTVFPHGASAARGLARSGDDYWVGGYAIGAEGNLDFALARYEENGALDGCYGRGGLRTIPLTVGADDSAYALALQKNGQPVLAGVTAKQLGLLRIDQQGCGQKHGHQKDHKDHGDE